MARKLRVNLAGFHHIVNRSVARNNVYKCDDDKEKYLDILCKASKIYKVIMDDYCEQYLYDLFRYIEHNPIEAKITQKVGEYPFTLLATILNDNQDIIPCALHSKLKKEIEYEGIQEHLEMVLSEDELKILEIEKNKKIIQKEYQFRQEKTITLQEYFDNIITKEDRNRAILKALDDGYRQIEIAKYLNLSSATISKVFRAVK